MTCTSLQCSLSDNPIEAVETPAIGNTYLLEDRDVTFAGIYDRYQKRLHRIALRIVKNDADAEDAVQESLLRAYTKMDGFRGDAAIYTWLVRIVINTSLMVLRKRSRHTFASLDCEIHDGEFLIDLVTASGITAEAKVIQQEITDIMYAAVEDLSPELSALMFAWIGQEPSILELSNRFGITIPATKSRLLRGKEKVAKTVKRRLHSVGCSAKADRSGVALCANL